MLTSFEHILGLFDSIWFEPIMEQSSQNHHSHTTVETNQHFKSREDEEAKIIPQLQLAKTIHFKSHHGHDFSVSSGTNSISVSESPTSVLPAPKRNVGKQQHRKQNRRNGTGCGKSLAELELEELEGFIDLGFVFSEEDQKDPNLVSIVPGIKRLLARDSEGADVKDAERPYLSEAWDVMNKKEDISKRMSLINMYIRQMGTYQNETLVKEMIKSWAHSVAYAVR